jgi:hypothetical protein
MHKHPNARLSHKVRLRLYAPALRYGRSPAELATENGISLSAPTNGWPGNARAV